MILEIVHCGTMEALFSGESDQERRHNDFSQSCQVYRRLSVFKTLVSRGIGTILLGRPIGSDLPWLLSRGLEPGAKRSLRQPEPFLPWVP